MAMYNLADVVLDSYMFGGDTTTREAFEAGAPIVTLPGKYVGERWTQAYYKMLGIHDLIAVDEGDYVRLATSFGRNKTASADIRKLIKGNAHKLYRSRDAADTWTRMLLNITRR